MNRASREPLSIGAFGQTVNSALCCERRLLYASASMQIKHYYSPHAVGEVSGEAMIFKLGVGQLLDEIRQAVLQSHLTISNTPTITKGKGITGIPNLAAGLNDGLAATLRSLGW